MGVRDRLDQTFEDYAKEEVGAVLRGDRLLAPEQIMERWGISRRELYKFHRGEHGSGVLLPALKLGKKTIRYRLRDVLRVEHEIFVGTP